MKNQKKEMWFRKRCKMELLSTCVSFLSKKAKKAYVKQEYVCFYIGWWYKTMCKIQKKVNVM
jgi:hypothetical protein